ncbi:MAG: hypothetical protein M3Q44_07710 [bacterium]|nr:hypothetical protein [bacterium]
MKGVEKIKSELPTMLKDTMKELVIENIITHGDAGAANGTIEFLNGAKGAFSDIFKFSSHGKSAKIKKITIFIIEIQR